MECDATGKSTPNRILMIDVKYSIFKVTDHFSVIGVVGLLYQRKVLFPELLLNSNQLGKLYKNKIIHSVRDEMSRLKMCNANYNY